MTEISNPAFWFQFAGIWGLFMLTVATPGPDFLIVTRTSLTRGLRAGLATAIGIGSGLLFHCSYCVLGIGLLIKHTPLLFDVLRALGGLYIGYLGVQSLRSPSLTDISDELRTQESILVRGGWLTGFLVNVLNVKAMLWFLVFFTSVLPETYSFEIRVLFAVCALLGATVFFCFLALMISRPLVVRAIRKSGRWFNLLIGFAFLAIAAEILWGLFR